ncbi:MAG: ABC transporter permease [Actinobacteria bacterium]|nr:ABC transporter permease [Actinomycetota bacterium]
MSRSIEPDVARAPHDVPASTEPATTTPSPPRAHRPWLGVLERYSLLGLLVETIAVFSVLEPDLFPTSANFRATMASQAVLAVAALAAMIPLLAGQFDLSTGANLGLAAVVFSAAVGRYDVPLVVAIVLAIGSGALVGLLNGVLVTRFSINSLIVTLGVVSLIRGALERYAAGQVLLEGIPQSFKDLGSVLEKNLWFGVPRIVYVMAAVAIGVWYVVDHTPFGRYLSAVGSNSASARLVGLRVDRVVIGSFVVGGALAGVAGLLQVGYSGQANPAVGPNFTLPALAAAFLGASAIRPGRYNVGGTLIAIYFLATAISGLNFVGLGRGVEPLFNGTALIVGVGLSSWLGRRRRTG